MMIYPLRYKYGSHFDTSCTLFIHALFDVTSSVILLNNTENNILKVCQFLVCLLANILYRADCAVNARERYSAGCKQPNERSQCKKTSSEFLNS